jgi:hypothetical protein
MAFNVCSKLLETYDTNCLCGSDKVMQEMFIESTNDENTGRKILTRLIKNHYNAKKPVSEYISGPYSMTESWSQKYKKRIYVVGEIHGSDGNCGDEDDIPSISDYYSELFKNTDVLIDFYLETTKMDEDEKSDNPEYYINIVRDMVNNCVARRGDKKCELIRAHFIDIRLEERGSIRKYVEYLMMFKEVIQETPEAADVIKQKFTELIVVLKKLDYNTIYALLFTRGYLWKERRRSYMKDEILEYTTPILQKRVGEYQEALSALDKSEKLDYDLIVSVLVKLVNVEALQLDVYGLSRIFKKFQKTELEYPDEAHNIIYHVGDDHAIFVRGFLSHIGFDLVASDENDPWMGERCIQMKNIEQPLFSKCVLGSD